MTRLGRSSGLVFYAEAQGCKENLVHSGLPLREFHTQKLRETSALIQYIPTSTDLPRPAPSVYPLGEKRAVGLAKALQALEKAGDCAS